MRFRVLLFIAALAALPSCKKAGDLAEGVTDGGPESLDHPGGRPGTPGDPLGPPSPKDLPTTDGAISQSNLDAQIAFFEGNFRQPGQAVPGRGYIPSLLTRSQYVGRIADAERAMVLADDLVRLAPDQASSYLTRASTRSGMHLFAAALADLAEAEKHGAKPTALVGPRATVLEAQGDLDGALALRHRATAAEPDLVNLTLEASLLGVMGKTAEATELFRKAPSAFPSVSVFPVAWMFLQEGLFWERLGETARARTFYEAAHERLPCYGHAASHLALMVSPARGIELLLPIVVASDDPEFEMILAGRLRANGQAAEADTRLAHVRARYAELVEKHPEGYAEHAGWFLLDEGKDPAKAYALAVQNLAIRKTEKAYQLALLSALAAGKRDEACKLGVEAQKLPYAGEMLRGIAAGACKP
jgi:tetratricopeptide (TPR) repeat protein